jgi:hypothetical protein
MENKKFIPCDNCPIRLYNSKGYNLSGIGNALYGNCIVIPNVDYIAYKHNNMDFSAQVKIIEECLSLITGVQDSTIYIVPLIRCNESISCDITNDIINKCLYFLERDIRKYDFKNILLLGSAVKRFLNIDIKSNINNLYISNNNRRYYVNYSPLVKYTSDELFKEFESNLQKWYNTITTKNYNHYLHIKI